MTIKLTMTAISDPKELANIKDEVDHFIIQNNGNPFFLYPFVERQMQNTLAKGMPTIFLIFRAEGNIIGIVPLLLKEKDKMRSVTFLFEVFFTPDFEFINKHRAICMKMCFDFIFKKLRCKFISLDLSANSPNLTTLIQTCKDLSISIRTQRNEIYNHAVIQVQDTWERFQQVRGKNYQKKMRQLQSRLENTGSWEIRCFTNEQNEDEVFEKIAEVEQACWKQNWRLQRKHKTDEDLSFLWDGSKLALRTHRELKRYVWLLYLNGKVIAYNLAIEYDGIIYMCKTSFDDRYRNLYPGIFLINKAIQNSFEWGNIRMIDFMSNLPFHKRWTRSSLVRVRFLLIKGIIPNLHELVLIGSVKSNAAQLVFGLLEF